MVKQVNKMLNKILSKVSQPKKIVRKVALKKKTKTKTGRKVMPAAYTVNYKKKFSQSKSGTNTFVTGNDLVYKVPDSLYTTGSSQDVFCIIPSNPAYWLGTRISAIASGYQYYRPIYFKVHYVPQVAVTQPGNVIFGTLWNNTPTPSSLQQSLKTSPGGDLVQCYKATSKSIPLGTNLPQRNFKVAGELGDDSMPFVFVAICPGVNSGGSSIVPGYFYIEYKYRFCNPIGGGSTAFYNSELVTFSSVSEISNNMTFLLASILDDRAGSGLYLGAGSKLDVEVDSDGDYEVKYHGTTIQSDTSSLYGVFLSNTQLSPTLVSRSVPYSVKQHLVYKYHSDSDPLTIPIAPLEFHILLLRKGLTITQVNAVFNPSTVTSYSYPAGPMDDDIYVCVLQTTAGVLPNVVNLGDVYASALVDGLLEFVFTKPVTYDLIFYLSPETSSSDAKELKFRFIESKVRDLKISILEKYPDVSNGTMTEESKILQEKKIDSESLPKLRISNLSTDSSLKSNSNIASQISEIAKSAGIRLY